MWEKEEEEEEEEDTSWTGKLRALVYKIKGPPKPEKKQPIEEEERYPSKWPCLSITVLFYDLMKATGSLTDTWKWTL